MKNLTSKIYALLAIVLMGVCVSAIAASAFQNLSTTGGGTTGGGGGGGTTPSLSQVTAVGASTNDLTTFNGGLVFTNATGTYVTSTQFTANGSGSATEPLFKMLGGGVAYGLYMNGSNQAAFTANGVALWYASQNEFTVGNGSIRALNDNATSLGLLNTRYSNMFSVNASSTNTSSTNSSVSNLKFTNATSAGTLSIECGTANAPGIRGSGAGQDTGLCINNSDQIIFILNGNTAVTFDPANGVQFSRTQPVSPGSGDIGVATSRWGGAYLNNVTSSQIYLEKELRINGTSTAGMAAVNNYTANFSNLSIRFPAGATSVIINDSFIRSTTSTHIQASLWDFDATMGYVQGTTTAVGQIRLRAQPSAPTADAVVHLLITNEK